MHVREVPFIPGPSPGRGGHPFGSMVKRLGLRRPARARRSAGTQQAELGLMKEITAGNFDTKESKARQPQIRVAAAAMALALVLGAAGCAETHYGRSTGQSLDDTATTSRVERALSDDTTYRFPNVKVTTFKGTVQLSGFVDDDNQRARAFEIARAVSGVDKVENQITLKPTPR